MGIIAKQSLQNTVITYAGVAIGFVLTIFLYPRILTTEQYGLTRALLAVAMISTQFGNLGMKNTIIRYFPTFRNEDNNHHGFLFLSLVIPFLGMIIVAVLLSVFRQPITQYFIDQSPLLVDYYWFILPLAFFILFFHVLTNYMRALYDTIASSFLMDIGVRLLAVILLVVYFMGWITFEQFILIFVLNYAAILLALIIYLFRISAVSLKPDLAFLTKPLAKKMANYSLFAFFGGVASVVVANIDIIMITGIIGLGAAGVYAIAFYIGSSLRIINQSVYKISGPVISDAFTNKNIELIEEIYKRSALNQLIIGGLLLCGIIANLQNITNLLPPEYGDITLVAVIIGGGYLFQLLTGLNGGIILNSEHYRYDFLFTSLFILTAIILNYLLIPIYGIVGAAIATACAIVFYNLLKVVFVEIKFSIQPFQWQMLSVFIIGALTLFITFKIPLIANLFVDIVLRSLIVVVFFITPIWLLNISENINQLIDEGLGHCSDLLK